MARNPLYEQALMKLGCPYNYHESIPLGEIDREKSLRNNVREIAEDPDLIEAYALADKEGAEFPPLVLWRPGARSRYRVADGNQRLAAKTKNRRGFTDAYVLDTADPMVLERVSSVFNNLVNGKRLTPAETLAHAAAFVRRWSVPIRQVAVERGLKERSLHREVTVLAGKDVLQAHKVPVTPTLSDDKIWRMISLQQLGEEVFAEACRAVGKTGVTNDEVQELVRSVHRGRTLDEKMAKLKEFSQSERAKVRAGETKGGRVKLPSPLPRDRLAGLLVQAQRLKEDYPPQTLRPAADYKQIRAVAIDVVELLIQVFGLGARPEAKEVV